MSEVIDELRELYQALIIDHGTKPKNFRKSLDASAYAEGFNPLCGDRCELYLKIENQHITDACFQGQGCAISVASASLLTESIIQKSVTDALALFNQFQNFMTSEDECDVDLGKLTALSGVRTFPTRIKCATLAWHTLKAALEQDNAPVSTE